MRNQFEHRHQKIHLLLCKKRFNGSSEKSLTVLPSVCSRVSSSCRMNCMVHLVLVRNLAWLELHVEWTAHREVGKPNQISKFVIYFYYLRLKVLVTYPSPEDISKAVNVFPDLFVFTAVFDVDPGAQQEEARPEDEVKNEREGAEPEPLEHTWADVCDDHDGDEGGGGTRECEYVLAVVVFDVGLE